MLFRGFADALVDELTVNLDVCGECMCPPYARTLLTRIDR